MKRFSILRGLAAALSVAVFWLTFALVDGYYACSGGPSPEGWFVIAFLVYAMFAIPLIVVVFAIGCFIPIRPSRTALIWWLVATFAGAALFALALLTIGHAAPPQECG